MGKVQDDALYILRHMLEQPYGTDFVVKELRAMVALPAPAFNGADQFLLDAKYVEATLGGEEGREWVTTEGVSWHEGEMQKRLDLSLLAERVLRMVVEAESEVPRMRPVFSQKIQKLLGIDVAPCLTAVRELADASLVEEVEPWDEESVFVRSTAAGRNAVRRGFRLEAPEPNSTVSVGNIIGTVVGGNVQGVGQASQSEITQTANDPQLLAEALDKLVGQLIDTVKDELPAQPLIAYMQTTEELKAELKADKPQPAVVKRLLGTLAFLGDIEGTIGLAGRVWQFIGPLVPLALTVLQSTPK